MAAERPAFPNYTQLPVRVPIAAWRVARTATLLFGLTVCALLVVDPDTGLKLFWKVLVPVLPLLWFTMPGLWRNLCPLASSNGVPRVLKVSRGATLPAALSKRAYQIGLAAFLVLVPARKVVFNRSGPATAGLLVTVLALALLGGYLFKGKSGWCSTICPLLPVQRLYGETPFLLVRNSHCEPCVGCAKNCFDFNPRVAKLTDLDDDDPRYAAPRRLFAAAFPGLVLGFFSMPDVPDHSVLWVYGRIGLCIAASIGIFTVLENVTPLSTHKLTAVFAAIALNSFYWYSVPTLVDALGGTPDGTVRSVAVWGGRLLVFGLTVPWLLRTFAKERPYLEARSDAAVVAEAGLQVLRAKGAGDPVVHLLPDGPDVVVAEGTPVLDVIENAGLPIEAGCRLGVCGADPVAVVDGADALSPMGSDEASTIARLGLGASTRLACQARVHGPCSVSLALEDAGVSVTRRPAGSAADPAVRRLVVIGNGIAGSTAADHARRLHPDCEIDVVAMEPHRLYNRMAISRLIHGRSAMDGLYLLPDTWHDDNAVTCWLNTRARHIDLDGRAVLLATGERLPYDRLILATGSRSVVPDVPGAELPGSFTLRRAEDAIAIRAVAQAHDVHAAVVVGGGLLGLEAAYSLRKLGLDTTVLERGPWLMRRQLDEPSARVLERYLDALGITVMTDAVTARVHGDGRVAGVDLVDGRRLECGLFLACPGVVPNVELAREAGLEVGRGVLVDRCLRTSDPAVYAAGEVAEVDGELIGLWPQSARQGEVAGVNAVGGSSVYEPSPATARLKVAGAEVASIGRFEATEPGVVVIVREEDDAASYRKLVVNDGRAVGAILIGHPLELPAVQRAIEEGRDVSDVVEQLRAGDWSVLDRAPAGVPV
jgi:NADPH-dependent 2,4-dienoyl-CoA reductase/sulfur reductase-like enzyme/ferredoxin